VHPPAHKPARRESGRTHTRGTRSSRSENHEMSASGRPFAELAHLLAKSSCCQLGRAPTPLPRPKRIAIIALPIHPPSGRSIPMPRENGVRLVNDLRQPARSILPFTFHEALLGRGGSQRVRVPGPSSYWGRRFHATPVTGRSDGGDTRCRIVGMRGDPASCRMRVVNALASSDLRPGKGTPTQL